MAFKDSFHEIVPGYRINGDAVVFVIKGVKTGGVGAGSKMIEIGNIGVANRKFIETPDPDGWPIPDSYTPVEDIDKLFEQLELSGLSTVVDGRVGQPVQHLFAGVRRQPNGRRRCRRWRQVHVHAC